MKTLPTISCLLLYVSSFSGWAEMRGSASYAISAEIASAAGGRATSASYASNGSAGSAGGIATAASPVETMRSGFAGQLYEIAGLSVTAVSLNVNEGSTDQLGTWQVLDDASLFAVPAGSVAWSVLSGPVTGIDGTGLATAGMVSGNTAASVQGIFAGLTGNVNLTVLDSIPDNFGSYASDGIDDAWQVQYFGPNNPNAAPDAISDASGLTNRFKYTAGLIPANAASTFLLHGAPAEGQQRPHTIQFSPTFPDRQYAVELSTDLTNWTVLTGPFAGTGGTMGVTDPSAGARKFYRVQISKP